MLLKPHGNGFFYKSVRIKGDLPKFSRAAEEVMVEHEGEGRKCTSKTPGQIMRRWRKCNRDGGYNPFWWPFLRITLAFCLEICPFPSPPENVSKRGRSVHYSGFWMHTWPGQLRWESAPNPARNKCAHLFSFAPRSAPSYPGHAAGVTLNISSSQQHTRTPR